VNLPERVENEVVWEKGSSVPGLDPSLWRRDDYGELIYRYDFGNRDSLYGWEVDHIDPWHPEPEAMDNLRPLNWVDNVRRGKMERFFRLHGLRSGDNASLC
jgi:hypothetical protein